MVPVGFNAKVIEVPQDWLGNPQVKEILSVSECISESPIDHTSHWLCNQWLLYNSEIELNKAVAKMNVDYNQLRWFFYEVYEKELDEGEWCTVKDLPSGVIKPEEEYIIRGFDVVSFTSGSSPECSPLSCNSGAKHFDVNQFCLVDTLDDAIEVTKQIDKVGGFEPGPYRIMSVFEKNSQQ